MTIADTREKCKRYLARVPRDVLIISILVLASVLSFWLGLLAGQDVGQGRDTVSEAPLLDAAVATTSTAGGVVASKNGTKYYLPGCAGASRISDANKVWFASAAAAEAQGYAPAANCKGL